MNRTTYINLPAQDLERTTAFFTKLGFAFDPDIHSDDTRCMVISDAACVMWHTEAYFAQFTDGDSTTGSVGFSAASREEVDDLIARAVAAGGTDAGVQDLGFMYMRAFRDPDGHRWSPIHMEG